VIVVVESRRDRVIVLAMSRREGDSCC
jgi:hypothetical protein